VIASAVLLLIVSVALIVSYAEKLGAFAFTFLGTTGF